MAFGVSQRAIFKPSTADLVHNIFLWREKRVHIGLESEELVGEGRLVRGSTPRHVMSANEPHLLLSCS